jgi:hypothetical protein
MTTAVIVIVTVVTVVILVARLTKTLGDYFRAISR